MANFIKENKALVLMLIFSFIITSVVFFPYTAFATDATDKEYANAFMHDTDSGDSVGWDQGVLVNLSDEDLVDGGEDINTIGNLVGNGWDLLFTFDKLFIGFAIVIIVAKIVGRAIFEIAFGGAGQKPPSFLCTRSEKSLSGAGRGGYGGAGGAPQSSKGEFAWLGEMLFDFGKGIALAAGVVLILNLIIAIVLTVFTNAMPSTDFNYFGF